MAASDNINRRQFGRWTRADDAYFAGQQDRGGIDPDEARDRLAEAQKVSGPTRGQVVLPSRWKGFDHQHRKN